jgi:hypothetical protein
VRRRTGKGPLLALALLAAAPAAAEVEIAAGVDREVMPLGDQLIYTVTVTLSGQESAKFAQPAFREFEVRSRASSEQISFAFGSGGPAWRKTTLYTFALAPKREGKLTIEPAQVTVGGQTHSSEAITVEVGDAAPGAPAPPAPAPRRQPRYVDPFTDPFAPFRRGMDPFEEPEPTGADVFVRATVDRARVYLGEQVTLSVHLFSRTDVSALEQFTMPRLDGFWTEDIESPKQIAGEIRYVGGAPYHAYLLKRRALFPLRSGTLRVDPVKVDAQIGLGLIFGGRSVKRTSQPVAVEVLPLPADGVPDGFEGNVGDWDLRVEVEPREATLAQPVTVRIAVEGRGNLRNLVMPRIEARDAPGFRVYDPTPSEKPRIQGGRFGGRKVLEYVLVPERTGTLEAPALRFSYFSPEDAAYRVVTSPPVPVAVRAGAAQAAGAGTRVVPPATAGQPANLLVAGFRPIRYTARMERKTPPLWRRPWFAPAVAAPPLVVMFAAGMERVVSWLRGDPSRARVRRAQGRARKRLKGAEALLGAGRAAEFYAEVERALIEFVTDRCFVPARGLTHDDLRARLLERGYPAAPVDALLGELAACELGRFAPDAGTGAPRAQALDRAREVIVGLEEAERRRGKNGGAAAEAA